MCSPESCPQSTRSLQHFVLSSSPSWRLPPEYEGHYAGELVSSQAIIASIKEKKIDSLLSPEYPPWDFPRGLAELAFGTCPDKKRQQMAQEIINEQAHRVHALLYCLLSGPALSPQRQNNPWSKVSKIILGGGLTQGYYGYAIKKCLEKNPLPQGKAIILPQRRRLLPLLGISALSCPRGEGAIVALAIGFHRIRRAKFLIKNKIIYAYTMLASLPLSQGLKMENEALNPATTSKILASIEQTMEETRQAGENVVALALCHSKTSQKSSKTGQTCFPPLENPLGETAIRGIEKICSQQGIKENCFVHEDAAAMATLYRQENPHSLSLLLGSLPREGFPLDRRPLGWKIKNFDLC